MDINLSFFNPVLLIKIITLIAIVFYIIFTFVLFTQIKVMNQILSLPYSPAIIRSTIIVNIIFAISLFAVAFVIL